MTPTFPKFRFPSFRDFLSLFHRPVHVGSIIAGLERQAKDLEAAIHHHADLADLHDAAAAEYEKLASLARSEMGRAARVAGKLSDLIA